MSPSFYYVVVACHVMLYRAKKRAVMVDNIRNFVSVHGVLKKLGFFKVQHRKRLAILTRVSSKHR